MNIASDRFEPLTSSLAHSGNWPIFIMGMERSGTSTLAAFCKELGYSGEVEGHVFSLLFKLQNSVTAHFISNGFRELKTDSLSKSESVDCCTIELISKEAIDSALSNLWKNLIEARRTGLWFDKTPGPDFIRCAPKLLQMYPNARFIFLIRDPISAVISCMKKFSNTFDEACDRWKECAEAWLQVKGSLPMDAFIEIKTHELSARPHECLKRISELLASHPLCIPWAEIKNMRFHSIERTSMNELSVVGSLQSSGFSDAQKSIFNEKCLALAELLGFAIIEKIDSSVSNSLVFSPPCGQKGLETSLGIDGGVWPQLHEGEMHIFLHPSSQGAETSITYYEIDFPGPGELVMSAVVLPEAETSVEFEVQLSSDLGLCNTLVAKCVCNPGEKKMISLRLAQVVKCASVMISVRCPSNSFMKPWSLISCPKFTLD